MKQSPYREAQSNKEEAVSQFESNDSVLLLTEEEICQKWNPRIKLTKLLRPRMETWEIVHIPEKPPFPPHQQPTGGFITKPYAHFFFLSLHLLIYYTIYIYIILYAVDVLAAAIEPKLANTLVRFAPIHYYFFYFMHAWV